VGLYVVYAVVVAFIGVTVAQNTWYLAGFILCGLVVLSSLFEVRTLSWKIYLGWIIALIISVDVSVHRNNRFLVPAFGNIDREFVLSYVEQARGKSGHYRALLLAGNLSDEYDLGNAGLKLQFPSINSYNGFTLERWQNYLRYMAGPESFDLVVSRSINQRFYGAFSLQMQSIVLSDPGILGIASVRYYSSKKGNSENVDALPRAYAVSHYTRTDTEEESLAAIKAQLGVLGETVILEGGTPSFIAENQPPHKNGQVEIRRLVPNEVELQVSVTRPSMVILTDAFYPGWKAYVDGEATEIFRANSLFRAVEVPPGRHTVLFKFRPDSLFLGFVMSLASVGLLAAFLFGTWIVGRRASDFRT